MRCFLVVTTVFSLAFPPPADTSPDLRPELEVSGRIDSIEVNPAGEIWIGTATGYVYVSRDWNRTWSETPVPVRRYGPQTYYNDSISQIRFFDARRAIVTGYLGDAQNLVYRTTDAGASWSAVTLPSALWVYDATTTPAGLGWLVGSDGSVLYSSDFGASWTALTAPFDQVSRSHSVHFVSPSLGVVGSLHGSLKLTRDGGRSWRRVKTPSEKSLSSCKNDRVARVRILGQTIILQQCDEVFYLPLSLKDSWTQLRAGDQGLIAFELSTTGLVGITSDLGIVNCAPSLKPCGPAGFRLEAYPLDIAVGAGSVVFLDSNLKVSVLNERGFRSSRMMGGGKATQWPIIARDRGSDDVLWGISRFFLYRSSNAGDTWERQVELPKAMAGAAIQSSGEVLLWDGHGYVARWSKDSGRLLPVPGLDGLDIVGLFRRGNLWLAYGGMQYETTQRIEVARTYYSGQFAGSADHGFVGVSLDGGSTWQIVDEWKEGGVQALYLGEDNTLMLLSWLCAVRRGRLALDPAGRAIASLQTILPANEETRHQVPYVERVDVLEFLGGAEGWVKGWTHHLGDFLFHTADGGNTWGPVDVVRRPLDRLYRLANGSWLGLVPPHEIVIWADGDFAPLRKFGEEIEWAMVDATGGLMLQLDSGEIWVLQPDRLQWRLLSGSKGSPR